MASEAFSLVSGGRQREVGDDPTRVAATDTGERAAFDRLMREHERRVWGLASHLLGGSDEVPDVTQQAFLRLYRRFHRLDRLRSPWPYLCRIVVNLCRDTLRRQSRWRSLPLEELGAGEEPQAADPTPGEEALLAERQRLLRRCLGQLSPGQRQAIVLRDIEGLSTEEVARLLGSTPTTVRSQISRARLRLRELLASIEETS